MNSESPAGLRTHRRLARASSGRNVADILRRPARLHPAKTAVVDTLEHPHCRKPHAFTWAEIRSRVEATAGLLVRSGLEISGRVAVLSLNSHHYFELYFAVPHAGGLIVPLNYRLGDSELLAQLEEAEPSILVSDRRFEARANELAEFVPSLRAVLSTESEEWEENARFGDPLPLHPSGEEDAVGIFYTGGASGRAKGVVLTHRNLYDATVQIALAMGYGESDVYLHAGPMFHLADGAGSLACTLVGATHAFIPAFETGRFMETACRYGVTTVTLVPTMYSMLLDSADFDAARLARLRRIFFSAAPMPESMIRRIFEVLPCGIGQGYGMTEASSRISVMQAETYRAVIEGADARTHLLSSAGREVPGLEVRIAGEDGRELEPGEVGEVVVSGTVVMKEYWRRPDLTGAVLEDGWLHTGDLGYKDADGYLYIVDRLKDMIITGGENVYCLEVENVLGAHPEVAEAAVIGVPDDLWGERVHAFVVPRRGAGPDVLELQAYCRSRIAAYKTPKSIEIVDELPRSAAGKVLKDELKRRCTG